MPILGLQTSLSALILLTETVLALGALFLTFLLSQGREFKNALKILKPEINFENILKPFAKKGFFAP